MTNWSPSQVKALWQRQIDRQWHPYTCPNRGDGQHFDNGIDKGGLIPTTRGWICQCCDYTQDWAHGCDLPEPAHDESGWEPLDK